MLDIKNYVLKKKEELKKEVKDLGRPIKLVIVQVNDDPASNAYIRGKIKDCEEIGANYELIKLSPSIKEEELFSLIDKLNKDNSVTGFIVQLPLPKGFDEEKVKRAIISEKDIDGFNPLSTFVAATPNGIVTFLTDNNYDFKGKNAVIIGRSNIVGKPIAMELLAKDMNVTILHSKTKNEDLRFYLKHADLVIVSVGKEKFLTKDYELKKDAVVIDVGINRNKEGKLCGDCESGLDVKFQSPVPGGVGLLTRLALLINLVKGAKNGF